MMTNSCFESDCSCQTTRIHLPVADVCSANCYYCTFRENRNVSSQPMPGHSRYIPIGRQRIEHYLSERMKLLPECSLIAVSGPGDILSSNAQLRELVSLVTEPPYDEISCCICTNGWDFFDAFSILEQWKTLKYITVTINALHPQVCAKIYRHPNANEEFYKEKIKAQMALLKWAEERNVLLKINTVLSNYNSESVLDMWHTLRQKAPIHIFNLLRMQGQKMDSESEANLSVAYRRIMDQAREADFNLKYNCKYCRSDSYGRW